MADFSQPWAWMDAVVPVIGPIHRHDAAFNEADHPRDEDGKFAEGGGGGKLSVKGMKKVGGQLGSNPGAKMEAPDGKRYYVKFSKSKSRAQNELLASRLYEAAGAPVLAAQPVDLGEGKLGTATEWQEGVKLIDRKDPEQVRAAQANFATHAWLANWDAVGLEWDNQGMVGDKMTTLDPGGSLIFRAQGGLKGEAFGHSVGEWDTLRDPKNHQAASIFGAMTKQELRQSAKAVVAIPDLKIRELVMEQGPGDESQRKALATKLIARKHDIARRAGLLAARHDAATWNEADHPRDPEGKFATGGGGGGGAKKSKQIIASTVPKPFGWLEKQKNAQAYKISKLAAEGIEADEPLQDIADKIKAVAGGSVHGMITQLANQVLAHIETEYGLDKGELGVAVKKPEVKKPKAPTAAAPEAPTAAPEPEPAQPPIPEPAGLPLPPKGPPEAVTGLLYKLATNPTEQNLETIWSYAASSNPGIAAYAGKLLNHLEAPEPEPKPKEPEKPKVPEGPAPHASSPGQQKIYGIATKTELPASAKITAIEAVLADPSVTGAYTKTFGQEWIAALGGKKTAAAPTPTPAPTPKPAAKPAPKGQHGGTVVTAPTHTARYKAAVARTQGAKKPHSTKDTEAHAICPSLSHGFWAKTSSANKKALGAYWNGSYGSINDALRAKTPGKLSPSLQKTIDDIDEMFYAPEATLEHDVRLTRGVDVPAHKIDEWVKQLEAGVPTTIQKTGYVSTSMAETPAFSHKNTWFIMTAKKGTPALGIDTISNHTENEVLLRHGQSFEVYEIERTPERTYVYMVSL